jgi:Flp pilus assembly protein TadD
MARTTPRSHSILATLTATLLLGACAQGGVDIGLGNGPAAETSIATNAAGGNDLAKATKYWGEQYSNNPADANAALAFAKNLKAAGQKEQAFMVLSQAQPQHPNNYEMNSELGRLAIEFDKLDIAERLLAKAEDPAKPDWRVVSARGTVLAKRGAYAEAIKLYERAKDLAPNQPSVLNNLAMAHVANGEAEKAEGYLREAGKQNPVAPRIRQNLALVLGLQGRYDESKTAAAIDLSPDTATQNADYLRKLTKLAPKAAPVQVATASAQPSGAVTPVVDPAKPAASATKAVKTPPATASIEKPATRKGAKAPVVETVAPNSPWSAKVATGNAHEAGAAALRSTGR